jgi:signal transduction histidine kinase/CheY-like chemotaxis protein
MKYEWWNQHFESSISYYRRIFTRIMFFSISIRLILSLFLSFDLMFASPQFELTLLVLLTLLIMKLTANWSPTPRKIASFIAIELLLIGLRIASYHSSHSDFTLFFFESSLLTIFFQANIFNNEYISDFIIVKHLLTWYFADDSFDLRMNNPAPIGICFACVSIWSMYEKEKRSSMMQKNEAQQAERTSNEQLAQILQLFPDGLIIINRKLSVKFGNSAIYSLLSTSKAEVVSRLKNITLDNKRKKLLESIMTEEDSLEIKTLGFMTINRQQLEWAFKSVHWANEMCWMIIVKNVTYAVELERIDSENRTKAALIRSISHELRTPVNGITMILNDLVEEIPENLLSYLDNIRTCTNLLNFQITDILDYSDLGSGSFKAKFGYCNLKKLLEECLGFVRVQALYKKLSLESDIDPSIPELSYTDGFRLQKVVMNLLSNALKFTSSGSIKLSATTCGEYADISVTDTGIGIPSSRLPDLFSLFSNRSELSFSGLGLSISQSILKLLGSELLVESTPGQGSCFSFSLKLCIDTPGLELSSEIVTSTEINVVLSREVAQGEEEDFARVMLVDDNDFNRMCTASLLRRNGVIFLEAVDGAEAVKKVQESDRLGQALKCILMDCNMPVMDGWDASREIRRLFAEGKIRHMPRIIAHTAHSAKEDIERCFEAGMDSYIIKPSMPEVIMAEISKYSKF